MCESLSSIIIAMEDMLEAFMQPLFNRCCELILQGLNGDDKQFAVKGLELAGVVIEHSCSLNAFAIFPLVLQSLDDKDISVRQYASATIGDLIFKDSPGSIDYVALLIPKLISCLQVLEGPDDISSLFSLACNNSACALSEISLKFPKLIENYISQILKLLLDCTQKTSLPQVKANMMCCVGKFGIANANALATDLSVFLYP